MTDRKEAQETSAGLVPGLPPCKRYIATHDKNGKSVYAEAPDFRFRKQPGFGAMARSYAIPSVPVVMKDDADLKAFEASSGPTSHRRGNIVVPNGGGNLMVIDIAPGAASAMHHTVSIDFSICVIGSMYHELDGAEPVLLRPGDHIVQRGTSHRWVNASKTEPARFVAVTLGAEPFDIPGKGRLEEWFAPSKPSGTPQL